MKGLQVRASHGRKGLLGTPFAHLRSSGSQKSASALSNHAAHHLDKLSLELSNRRENPGVKGVRAVEHAPYLGLQLGSLAPGLMVDTTPLLP